MQTFQISDGFVHFVLAEKLLQINAKLFELFTQHSKVERLKFTEDLGCEHIIYAVQFIAAAGHVNRNEQSHLFKDTVTESYTQLFDYPKVKLMYLFKVFLRYRVHLEGFFKHIIKM